MSEIAASSSSSNSPKGIILFILIAIIVGSAGVLALQQAEQKNENAQTGAQPQTAQESPSLLSSPIAPYTLVYGTWTGAGSVLKALDLSSGKYNTLATLPIDIKKVTVLSPDTLLYIDQTDARDYGKQLTFYSLPNQKSEVAVKAEEGYGIDDYVLSPDKKYVATWEVSIPDGASTLSQGRSRVYAVALDNPSQKNLIYDESAKTPVHYPVAILNNGKLFLDSFQANDRNGGTGWAYGMSVASFDGSIKQDLAQMANGTYGTQPAVSQDGNYLLFAGYDGSKGAGTALVNGFRRAVLTPNTVETLNTATLAREKVTQFSNKSTYTSVNWDQAANNIIVTSISREPNTMGSFMFDRNTKQITRLNLDSSTGPLALVNTLSSDKLLVGSIDNSQSSLSNLGAVYGASIKQFYAKDTTGEMLQEIKLPDPLMQYVALVPSNYFAANALHPATTQTTSDSRDAIQLYTFFMKPGLAGRAGQQAGTLCRELATEQCKTEMSQFDPDDPIKEGMSEACKQEAFRLQDHSHCSDSPLYLYGESGQTVKVTVHTPVSGSVPSYNDGYKATLLADGKFEVNGNTYSEITYDYTPAVKRLLPPTYGKFVSRSEVADVLKEYAKGLGLNDKETADLLASGKEKVTSPYAFVSFYNQKISEAILPLSFSPRPENYLNVVFYFKLLNEKPNFSSVAPTFGEPLNRSGFTAVEVSEIVE